MNPLRAQLSEAERLLNSGTAGVIGGKWAEAEATLVEARARFEALAARTDDPELRSVLLDRRVTSRVDRIVSSIRGQAGVEYFDVLDEEGSPTGERVASTVAHLTGAPHASLVVVLFNSDGRILLQHRAPYLAIFPGRKTFAATGHVAAGRTSRAAAIDEIEEEIAAPMSGTEIDGLDPALSKCLQTRAGESWLYLKPRPEALAALDSENSGIAENVENAADARAGYLRSVEFLFLDDSELATLRDELARCLPSAAASESSSAEDGIFIDVDRSGHTVLLFTFSADKREALEALVSKVEERTGLAQGVATENVERRSLFLYAINDIEACLIQTLIEIKRASAERGAFRPDASFTTGFEWVDLEALATEFRANPGRYTDGFMPWLASPKLVARIRRRMTELGR